ncbi:glycosyl transferase family 2 [Desulfovibrio sp. X2]|uniref:glycosyltransferase family 2 protein n=1 Tax=Desulfovibrio sp. X2 TaxID=941449 RepID=UPI00035879BF|nr:glycosyltransferase [Desulfovibrio sp. X2]EPR38653.1 glycosyl transferase family 2 [Desulfovibrio sp. X2]
MPLVSVLMPCYQAADTLAAAMESLVGQTLPDFEIVAVDDGSSDATWDVLSAFASRDARVRPLRIPHGGIVAALQAGLSHCRGGLVARMDADDVCLPDRLASQAALFANDPGLGVASCRVRFGGCRTASAGYAGYVDWINSLLSHEEMAKARFVEAPLAHPSAMVRADLLRACGGWREGRFPEDYDLWLRLFALGARFAKCPDELLVWNDPPGRLSRTHENYAPEAFYATKADYLAQWLAQSALTWPEVTVWGAGRVARRRAALLGGHGARIVAYVDIDPRKIGNHVHGVPVIGREDLPAPGETFVLSYVGSRGAREEIGEYLAMRGYVEGTDFLHVA